MQDEYGGDDECEEYGDQVDIVDPGRDDFEDPNQHAEGSTGIFIYIIVDRACYLLCETDFARMHGINYELCPWGKHPVEINQWKIY